MSSLFGFGTYLELPSDLVTRSSLDDLDQLYAESFMPFRSTSPSELSSTSKFSPLRHSDAVLTSEALFEFPEFESPITAELQCHSPGVDEPLTSDEEMPDATNQEFVQVTILPLPQTTDRFLVPRSVARNLGTSVFVSEANANARLRPECAVGLQNWKFKTFVESSEHPNILAWRRVRDHVVSLDISPDWMRFVNYIFECKALGAAKLQSAVYRLTPGNPNDEFAFEKSRIAVITAWGTYIQSLFHIVDDHDEPLDRATRCLRVIASYWLRSQRNNSRLQLVRLLGIGAIMWGNPRVSDSNFTRQPFEIFLWASSCVAIVKKHVTDELNCNTDRFATARNWGGLQFASDLDNVRGITEQFACDRFNLKVTHGPALFMPPRSVISLRELKLLQGVVMAIPRTHNVDVSHCSPLLPSVFVGCGYSSIQGDASRSCLLYTSDAADE